MSYLFDERRYEILDKYYLGKEGETYKYFIIVTAEHLEIPEEFYNKIQKGDWILVKTYFEVEKRVRG